MWTEAESIHLPICITGMASLGTGQTPSCSLEHEARCSASQNWPKCTGPVAGSINAGCSLETVFQSPGGGFLGQFLVGHWRKPALKRSRIIIVIGSFHSAELFYFSSWRPVTKHFMSFLNDIHFGSSWTNGFRINIAKKPSVYYQNPISRC